MLKLREKKKEANCRSVDLSYGIIGTVLTQVRVHTAGTSILTGHLVLHLLLESYIS